MPENLDLPVHPTVTPAVRAAFRAAHEVGGELGIVLQFLNAAAAKLWKAYQLPVMRELGLHGFHARTAVVAWDEPAMRACRRSGMLHCALDDGVLEVGTQGLEGGVSAARSWYDTGGSRRAYCRMMWRRVEVVAAALADGISVLLVDVDAIVLADPLCLHRNYPRMLGDPSEVADVDMLLTAWGTPANRSCFWAFCHGNRYNGGIYYARATDATRGFFARSLALRHGRTVLYGQSAGSTTDVPMLQRFHCDDQPYMAWQLRHDAEVGLLKAKYYDTRLIQSDGADYHRHCGVVLGGWRPARCEPCDKLIVHAAASGNFTQKYVVLERLGRFYLEQHCEARWRRSAIARRSMDSHRVAARACQRLADHAATAHLHKAFSARPDMPSRAKGEAALVDERAS